MSDFFAVEPPPPPPKHEVHRQPPWAGAPHGTLPGVVATELVLAQSERYAVCISRLSAYPTGFEFELLSLASPGDPDSEELDPMLFGPGRHRARARRGVLDDEFLRIGVQFADGAKATNLPGMRHHRGDEPDGPELNGGGGGGGGGRWRQSEWVWPLPPPGPLAFVCEWPAAGIPVTRKEIDAQLILDAAQRAQVIFAEDQVHAGGSASMKFSSQRLPDRPPPNS
ncbi:MAG: hypothetical protein ACLPV4_11965 [Solirubrobacteraceae bacterium]